MTIRRKLFLTFFSLCLVLVGSITVVVVITTRSAGVENFKNTAQGQLLRVDDIFAQYANTGKQSTLNLVKQPLLRNALGNTHNTFIDKTQTTENDYEIYNDYEKQIYDEFRQSQLNHPNYGLIFIGFSDGTIIEANEPDKPKDTFSAKYDPRKRPWYTQAMGNRADVNISLPYLSSSGFVVCSVTAKVQDMSSRDIGVVGIDFNLSGLTDYLSRLKIGQTGYVVVLSSDGLILANPADSSSVFKNMKDMKEQEFFARILSAKEEHFEYSVGSKNYQVFTHTTPDFGWRTAVLVEQDEVMAESVSTRNLILVLGAGLTAALLLVVFLLAKSFTMPIALLAEASGRIAQGDFSALPDASIFKGELEGLYAALKRMIANLSGLIEDAKVKTELAEAQTQKATEALAVADASRLAAEAAKREGMLQAAHQIDDIVHSTMQAVDSLSGIIRTSVEGADMQTKHASKGALITEEMNSIVLEVSRNSALAADTAQETSTRAATGAGMVSTVKEAVSDVTRKTDALKVSINDLGKQAQGISQVLTVITDIADQTNLLALNAAIEAARAGEAGRGFAVVADEVRKLAEKTMQATKEVGASVTSIQTGTKNSAQGMEEAVLSVTRSTELATKAENDLSTIVELSQHTATQIQSIAASSTKQSAASQEISQRTEEISRIAHETADAMRNAEQEVNGLIKLASKLEELINAMKQA